MKNFNLKSVLTVLFLATALISCSNDNDEEQPIIPEFTVKTALVTEVKGPEKGKVNEELSYDVTYLVDSACAQFGKISEVTIGTEKGLQVEAKYPSGACTLQVPGPQKTVYKFKSTAKGTFDIKFKKSETEFVTAKVVIE